MIDMLTNLISKKGSKADPSEDADLVSGLISSLSDGKSIAEAASEADDKTAVKNVKLSKEEEALRKKKQAEAAAAASEAERLASEAGSTGISALSGVTSSSMKDAESANARANAMADEGARGVLQELLNKKKKSK